MAGHWGEHGRRKRRTGTMKDGQGRAATASTGPCSPRPGFRPRYAAIDLGTNNCRLLVAEPQAGGFRVVDAFSRIVRLGEGLAKDGTLCEAAMERSVAALHICAGKLRRHRITGLRAVATEACRRAHNGEAFRERVRRETGLNLEVIAQEEEARLALAGCAPLLQPNIPNALVFDIGGGSTELIWLRGDRNAGTSGSLPPLGVAAWYSMPLGVVGLAEHYGTDRISPGLYEHMVAEVAETLTQVAQRPDGVNPFSAGPIQMIGTSGTVTTLAGVYQHLPRYDRRRVDGCYLGFDTVRTVSRRIAAMTPEERLENPCIGHQRADLVVAGCAILEGICRTWPVGCLRVADRGLREGMLLQMMGYISVGELSSADPSSAKRRSV